MNKKEYDKLQEASKHLTENALELLIKFNELNVTPSVNRTEIEAEYKTIQFGKLLSVDKGLKLRFEMCRTEEARKKIINDNVNLDGWDIIDDLMTQIEEYLLLAPYEFSYTGVNAANYLTQYEGDFHKAFGSRLRDITETELYLKFKNLETAINEITKDIPYLNAHVRTMDELKKAFKQSYSSNHIELDENFIIHLVDWQKNQDENIARWNKDQEELKQYQAEQEARQRAIFQAARK